MGVLGQLFRGWDVRPGGGRGAQEADGLWSSGTCWVMGGSGRKLERPEWLLWVRLLEVQKSRNKTQVLQQVFAKQARALYVS